MSGFEQVKIHMALSGQIDEISSAISHTIELKGALIKSGTDVKISFPKGQSIIDAFQFIRKIKKMSQNEPDRIIHVRSLRLAYLMSIPFLKPKCPILLEANGIWSDENSGNGIKSLIVKHMEYRALKKSEAIACVTPWIAQEYVNRGFSNSKFHVVENGVNTDIFKQIEDAKKVIYDKYIISPNSSLILFVGTFYPWQGIDVLIKSMPKVIENEPGAKLLIVGSGGIENNLKTLSKDLKLSNSVIFAGKLAHNEIPSIISASDVCVTLKKPMISGFSPIKLFEYLACEKPVVATKVKGFDFVNNVDCGILVEYNNEQETSDAILSLISNREKAVLMGKNGREYVLKNHTWLSAAKKISAICSNLVQ